MLGLSPKTSIDKSGLFQAAFENDFVNIFVVVVHKRKLIPSLCRLFVRYAAISDFVNSEIFKEFRQTVAENLLSIIPGKKQIGF